MPEVRYQYLGTQLLQLQGENMARGHVVAFKYDAEGNIMVTAITNPILAIPKRQSCRTDPKCNFRINKCLL